MRWKRIERSFNRMKSILGSCLIISWRRAAGAASLYRRLALGATAGFGARLGSWLRSRFRTRFRSRLRPRTGLWPVGELEGGRGVRECPWMSYLEWVIERVKDWASKGLSDWTRIRSAWKCVDSDLILLGTFLWARPGARFFILFDETNLASVQLCPVQFVKCALHSLPSEKAVGRFVKRKENVRITKSTGSVLIHRNIKNKPRGEFNDSFILTVFVSVGVINFASLPHVVLQILPGHAWGQILHDQPVVCSEGGERSGWERVDGRGEEERS